MSSVLTINGSTVNRPAARVTLDRLTLSMDSAGSLEFTEHAVAAGDGAYHEGWTCALSVDGSQVFSGRIVSASPCNIGSGPVDVGYRALDLRFLANLVPITGTDGTGVISYNFPSSDPDYNGASAGKSVGTILKALFDLHASALAAIGVTGYTASELTSLTVVPPEPVILSGRLWSAVEQLVARWCNKYAVWIDGAGLVHVVNTVSGLTPATLTLDSDPVVLGSVSRSHGECFTKVVVRGGADVQGAFLRLSAGSLVDASSAPDKAAWTVQDYYQPRDASDSGSISSMTSTSITVTSDAAARAWAANFWSDQAATLWVQNTSATDVTFMEQRQVISCTAMAAGGSATITVDLPFANSGYDAYVLRGNRTAMSEVWRKYQVPNAWIAQHLQQRFNHSVPFTTTGAVVAQTWTATAVVCWSSSGSPPYNEFPCTLQVVPYDGTTDGYVVFDQPVVFAFNSKSDLETGGSAVQAPDDLIVLLPYSRGALTATKPSSGYEGTAYTVDGVERTLTLDYPQWLDGRNNPQMAQLAQEVLDTVKDSVVEGTMTYLGKYSAALTLGLSLNIARAGGTTGWESLAAPVRSVTLEWPDDGANLWITRLGFSTRRRPFSGDRLYVHPAFGRAGAFQANLTAGHYAASAAGGTGTGVESGQAQGGGSVDASGFVGPPRPTRRKSAARLASVKQDRAVRREEAKAVKRDQTENARRIAAKHAPPRSALVGPPAPARPSPLSPDLGPDDHDLVMGRDEARTAAAGRSASVESVNRDQAENARRIAAKHERRKPKLPRSVAGAGDIPDDPFAVASND